MGYWDPIDRAGRARARQVARYLADHWTTPFPVVLHIAPIADAANCLGLIERVDHWRGERGPFLRIRLDSRMPTAWAIETLRHEWAHAHTWPASRVHEIRQVRTLQPDHDAAWRGVYGEIEAAFLDGNAEEDSHGW